MHTPEEAQRTFPIRLLKPRHAILAGEPCVSIMILMRPFLWNGEVVDTSIRLDGIELPSTHLNELIGKSFAFPISPEDGYINGSIYLESKHHPVDVTELSFPLARDGGLSVIVKGIYKFEHEGLCGLPDTPFTFGVRVSSCAI